MADKTPMAPGPWRWQCVDLSRRPHLWALIAVDGTVVMEAVGVELAARDPYSHKFARLPELIAERNALQAQRDELLEALKNIAAFPLEEFAMEKAPDQKSITGANDWQLTVGDIRKARAAITNATGE